MALYKNHSENILKKIEYREIFKINWFQSQEENIKEQQRKIIDIAAEELHELLDEPMRKNFGELNDEDWEKGLNEIASIVSDILEEHFIPIPTATLRAKIGIKEGEMPKYER